MFCFVVVPWIHPPEDPTNRLASLKRREQTAMGETARQSVPPRRQRWQQIIFIRIDHLLLVF
jgi:hypothetical protein